MSAREVERLRKPGRHAVGGGAYLNIDEGGRRQWWARGRKADGRRGWHVLGDARVMLLQEARRLAAQGIPDKAKPAGSVTFLEAATAYIEANEPTWKHQAHRRQWRYTVDELLAPLHAMRVVDIRPADVAAALVGLQDRAETLVRARARVEMIIDHVYALLDIDKANPARWKVQSRIVPALKSDVRRKVRAAVRHHPAPTVQQARDLWRALPVAVGSDALRLVMLCALRTSEARLVRWKDWDERDGVLTLPAAITKTARPLRIPVPAAAIEVLSRQKSAKARTAFIFPGVGGEEMSQDTLLMALKRSGIDGAGDLTVHGLRSTFRDWVRETGRDEVLAEITLGHAVGKAAEKAYARSDAFDRRRILLEEWADAVVGDGKVIALRRRA